MVLRTKAKSEAKMTRIEINETLSVQVVGGADAHLAIAREQGGLVRVEPSELRDLVAGLVKAAEVLARAAAKVAKK